MFLTLIVIDPSCTIPQQRNLRSVQVYCKKRLLYRSQPHTDIVRFALKDQHLAEPPYRKLAGRVRREAKRPHQPGHARNQNDVATLGFHHGFEGRLKVVVLRGQYEDFMRR